MALWSLGAVLLMMMFELGEELILGFGEAARMIEDEAGLESKNLRPGRGCLVGDEDFCTR
jgi:hypothetical protein